MEMQALNKTRFKGLVLPMLLAEPEIARVVLIPMWLPRSCVALWQLAFANRAQLPPDLLHQLLTWQIDDRNIGQKLPRPGHRFRELPLQEQRNLYGVQGQRRAT